MSGAIGMDAVAFAHPGGAPMAFDLALPSGCFALLTGPSGSGKSTLLSLLAGFETPNAGTIHLGGKDVTALDPAQRPVTVVFQEHNTFPHLDVATNVALGIAPRRIRRGDRERAEAALERVGLGGYGARLPGQLSGGERQRVALARAALRDRPVLLLDEPFAALGPALRADMLGLVADLATERGTSVLMVTHDPLEAVERATRPTTQPTTQPITHVVVLEGGRVHAVGPPALLTSDDPVIRSYLG